MALLAVLVSPAIPSWIPATVNFILLRPKQINPHAGTKETPDPCAEVKLRSVIGGTHAVRKTSSQHLSIVEGSV